MEQHNTHTEEKKLGFIGTITYPNGAGIFAFIYVLIAMSFIASLVICG